MRCTLQIGKGFIKDVTGVGKSNLVIRTGERSGQNRQDFVAAVARQNPVGVHIQYFGRRFAEFGSMRIRVEIQSPARRVGDGFNNARRRRIRILVRIQFCPASILRLLARHISGDSIEFRSKKAHVRLMRKAVRYLIPSYLDTSLKKVHTGS